MRDRLQCKPSYELRWRANRVAKLMRRKKIDGRSELAKVTGIGRATAYSSFNDDWSGRATTNVLAQIAGQFSVMPDALVEVVIVR